jgi:transposase-like protein
MRRFYLYRRGKYWYAQLGNPETGRRLTGKSTHQTLREKQMMKEMQELRESNQILKDALYFFAKDRKK